MNLSEILAQKLKTSANNNFWSDPKFTKDINTIVVTYIVSKIKNKDISSINQEVLLSALENDDSNDSFILPFIELYQGEQFYVEDSPLSRDILKITQVLNNHCAKRILRVLAPFVGWKKIEPCIDLLEGYPLRYLSTMHEVMADGLILDQDWLKNTISAAFASEKEGAIKELFKITNYYETDMTSNRRYVIDRSGDFIRKNFDTLIAAVDDIDTLFSHLDDEGIENAGKMIQKLAVNKPGVWQRCDEFLKKYNQRMVNASALETEDDIRYLQEQLLAANDAQWLVDVLYSIQYRSYSKSAALYSCADKVINYYLDNFDLSLLSIKHFSQVKDKALLVRLFSLFSGESIQQVLAKNFTSNFNSTDFNDSDWETIAKYPLAFSERLRRLQLSKERLHWFWELTDNNTIKSNILEQVRVNIAIKVEDNADYSPDLVFFQQLVKDGSAIKGLFEALYPSSYDQTEQKTSILIWPFLDNACRKSLIFSVDEDYDHSNADAQTLLALMAEEDLSSAIWGGCDRARYFILHYLTNQSFSQLLSILDKLEKSAAAVPHLAKGLANIDLNYIDEAQLYVFASKNIRHAAQWSLFLSHKSGVIDKIQHLLDNKKAKLDIIIRGDYFDRLESDGVNIDALDELKGVDIQGYVDFATKKLNKTAEKRITRIFTPDVAAYYADAKDGFAYALFLLSQGGWSGVPRYSRQFFDYLAVGKRIELTSFLIKVWSEGAADKNDGWVLNLLKYYGNDASVIDLQKLINAWCKKYKARTTTIIAALGEIDSALSLSACDEIYNKKKYSWSIRQAAKNALVLAAKRRGLSQTELYDELIPTLGLNKEGLVLDVGPYSYLVKIKPDLTFSVLNQQTGKISKSLPKMKPAENEDLYSLADVEFKTLKKNLKPVIKQLQARLSEALECGQLWQSQRWLALFTQHPILSLIGQGIVWQYQKVNDELLSFRLSEDGSLIDFDDEEVVLAEGNVSLWHHAESSQEEHNQWSQHFNDYELTGFVQQFSTRNIALPEYTEVDASLAIYHNKQAEYGKFKRIMEKNNYEVHDGDGSWISSYMRHYITSGWGVDIELEECRIFMEFDEEITLGQVGFYFKGKKKALNTVPKRLIATTVDMLDEIII